MTKASDEDKALRLQFNITQTIRIQLTRLKVYTYSSQKANPFKCHLCKYSSKYKHSVKRHLLSHTGEKPFACNPCNYKTSQRSNLIKHIMTHTGVKHFNCAFCTKSFARKAYKTFHETTCKVNPKQSDPSWVEMQKTFKCQVCPYSTADSSSSLNNHMRTHTGEKPFACNICNHKFSLQVNLRSHIFTHTREKPNNCQFCTKGFARTTHQKNHEKLCKLNPKQGDAKWIEEQKKFKCHFCTYRTIPKGSLADHLRSHTGEKPNNCPLCLYKCNNNSNLHLHLRRMHVKEKEFKCPQCDFVTLSTAELLNHVKGFHLKLCTNK